MTCPHLETIAAYTLDELGEEEQVAFEEHYFGCDACLAQAERMQRLVAELQATLPAVLTRGRRERLEASHPRPAAVDVQPGETASIRLAGDAPVGLWVMHAPLAGAERVDLEAHDASGNPLFTLRDVPFDAERGEVVLACQVHYRALPGVEKMRASLIATDAKGPRQVGEYLLDHRFESP
jgi:anti-sigma factor RsiW